MDLAGELSRAKDRDEAFKKSSAVKQIKPVEVASWGLNDPTKYHANYSQPKPLKKGGDLGGAFFNGNATHGNALLSRKSTPVLPGIFSFEEDFLLFLRDVANQANETFKVDVDDEGFSRSGIYAGFDTLKCPAGYFQTPMSYTTVDNGLYRKELGLGLEYTPRQKAIATEFWKLIFSEARPASVNVARKSTGGMRRFSSSVQWKLDFANFITQPLEFEKMLNAVANDDCEELANRYETLYATYIQKRGQVDSQGKIRKVFDLEYALSGGAKGKEFPTDKRVIIHGKEWDDFSAVRARVVHAGPWTVNCFLQMIATPTMQAMFHNFPATFHTNTREEIKAIIDHNYIYCSDVKEYDRSMSRDAISVVHDVMREYWDERLVKASWRLFIAPYYAKPLGLDSGKGTWVKDPMDWKQELFAGNRSGHALTSLIAKGNKALESMFIIDMMYPVLGRVRSVLEHKFPIKLINNGDDEVVVAKELSDMVRFKVLRSDLGNGHYVVEPEVGMGFSGQLLLKTDQHLIYNPSPRIHTSIQKMFVPEKGVDSPQREFWPIGMMVRIDNLTQTDEGRELWRLTLAAYRKHLEPRHGDIRAIIAKGASEMQVPMSGWSDIDKEVFDDKDKIHYKWLPEEVNPKVLDLVTAKIPLARTETIMKRYYKGNLV